jgi:hypothetical protein
LDKRSPAVAFPFAKRSKETDAKIVRVLSMNPLRRFFLAPLLTGMLFLRVLAGAPPDIYPLGADDQASETFTLRANALPVPVLAHTARYDYAYFSADGAVTLTLTVHEPVRTWQISPRALAIPAKVDGPQVTFTLPRAMYVIVKINDLKEIAIAVDPREHDAPLPAGHGIYNVSAAPYAADSTGRVLVTARLQRAIDDAHAAGGGIVYLPNGTFLSASLMLRSHVALYLAGGAVLRSSGEPGRFTDCYRKHSLNMNGTWFLSTEPGSEDIRIFGRGTIDGNARELRGKNHYLNNLVVPLQTSHFSIEGVVLRDSGLWGLIPTRSDHVVIRDTKHFNEADQFFEDDAVDIIECQDVLVSRTFAISEDDAYSTKTWAKDTDIAANWPGEPEELRDVVFENCLAWSRCAAFKVGFGNFQPQRRILFRNSTAYRCMRAVALNHSWGTAPTENVTFESIVGEGFQPRERDREKCRWLDINTGAEGAVVNTVLRHITMTQAGYEPSRIEGFSATAKIDGLRIEDVIIEGKLAASLADLRVGITNEFVTGVSFSALADRETR